MEEEEVYECICGRRSFMIHWDKLVCSYCEEEYRFIDLEGTVICDIELPVPQVFNKFIRK